LFIFQNSERETLTAHRGGDVAREQSTGMSEVTASAERSPPSGLAAVHLIEPHPDQAAP